MGSGTTQTGAGTKELIFGVDVSNSQGDVDFRALASSRQEERPPFRFAIVKATEGGDFEDARFRFNWRKLVDLDPRTADPWLIRGAYHFARQDNRTTMTGRDAGQTEAKWFCKVLKEVGHYGPGCLPPYLDWEKWSGSYERNREWIQGFVDVVFDELGRAPGLYTGPNVWHDTTKNWDGLVGKLSLWQVKYKSYGWDPTVDGPKTEDQRLLKNSTRWSWDLWQWSGGGDYNYYKPKYGEVPGVVSGVADVSRFDGTLAQLRALALLDDATPSEPDIVLPPVEPVESTLGSGIFQHVDLARFDTANREQLVAVVQGLLLAAGLGPDGLVGHDGRPDGKCGEKTLDALRQYKDEHGLTDDTVMDATTWWLLLRPGA